MLLDVSPPQLEILSIEGILQCDPEADAAAVALVLKAKFILIRAGGQFLCGTEEAPFGITGATLEIQLLGDYSRFEMGGSLRYTGGHPGVMTRLANRITVYGEMQLYGRSFTSWAFLNSTAPAGATEVVLQGVADWVTDALVVVTPSITIGDVEEVRQS